MKNERGTEGKKRDHWEKKENRLTKKKEKKQINEEGKESTLTKKKKENKVN